MGNREDHLVEGFKPCPFCDGKKLYWEEMMTDEEPVHYLVCVRCGVQGPTSGIQKIAGLLWDARPTVCQI